MKTKEELNELKREVETLNQKLAELSEDELAEVTGGMQGSAIESLLPTKANVSLTSPKQDSSVTTYKKDIGSDKNAKVIFS